VKKDIHPQLNDVKVVLTTGETVVMKSTLNKEEMKLDTDPNNHPAWTGKRNLDNKSGRSESFNKKFAGMFS
jgi:large subunit ribosomal protein L31